VRVGRLAAFAGILLLGLVLACGQQRVVPTGSQPAAGTVPGAAAPAQVDLKAVEDFYRGKTVKLLVGFTAGGGYDLVARLLSRHLSRHIPGNPSIIVENMPGATGLIASNHLYHQAPKDGTTLLLFAESALREELMGAEGAQFKAREFAWLGSTQVQTSLCFARTDSGIATFRDLTGGNRQLIVGTTGPGSNLHDFPATLRTALSANIRLVAGYPGSSDAVLAVESGELNGACIPWESIKVSRPHWFTSTPPYAGVLVQQGSEKHAELPNVPLAEEFATTEDQRQLIRLATSTLAISKPLMGPPGMPPDRVMALRQAFDAVMADPELLRDAEQAKIDLSPKSWDKVLAIVDQVLTTPPQVAERFKTMLEAS
jgi:tripartite-type tricarboxylate transporter receptor subunit TctC